MKEEIECCYEGDGIGARCGLIHLFSYESWEDKEKLESKFDQAIYNKQLSYFKEFFEE